MIQTLGKLICPWDPPRGETCLRVAVSNLIGVSIAVAPACGGTIISSSLGFLLGILAPTFSFAMPGCYFAIGLVFPFFIVVFIQSMAAATLILCTATVSDGLFVFMFVAYTFLIMGFNFGKDNALPSKQANAVAAIGGSLAFTLRTFVQGGFTITLPTTSGGGGGGDYNNLVTDSLAQACLDRNLTENCWTDSLPTNTTFEVTLPDDHSDMFGGRTVYVTPSAENVTVQTGGGLWIVSGLWSWSGLNNPFAIMRNFLIVVMWMLVCYFVAIMMPRMQTARNLLSATLVPASLKQATVVAESDQQDMTMGLWNTLTNDSLAKLIIFEPRYCRAPFQNLVPELSNLISKTQYAVKASFLRLTNVIDESVLKDFDSILKECADVLKQNNPDGLESSKDKPEQTELGIVTKDQYLYKKSDDLRDATVSWLDAMNHPTPTPRKEAVKNVISPLVANIGVGMVPIKRIFTLLGLIFKPKKWDWYKIFWCLRASAGYAILACMNVYWDAWANFAIQTGVSSAGTVFSGWVFYAYGFSWRPTLEGQFKKGFQRLAGTCLGGFTGWLGAIVCSGSYSDDAVMNPYGTVAWMVVFTVIAAYLGTDQGVAAQLGTSKDHGYVWAYYVETLAIVMLEVYAGAGHRNDVTANRITAGVVGVMLAMVLSLVPPNVKGGDPKYIKDYNEKLNSEWSYVLQTMLSKDTEKLKAKGFRSELSEDVSHSREYAVLLIKDADIFRAVDKVVPFWKVNKGFMPLLDQMAFTEMLMTDLLELSVNYLAEEPELITAGGDARTELESMIPNNTNNGSSATDDKKKDMLPESSSSTEDNSRLSLCLALARKINTRLKEHGEELDNLINKK